MRDEGSVVGPSLATPSHPPPPHDATTPRRHDATYRRSVLRARLRARATRRTRPRRLTRAPRARGGWFLLVAALEKHPRCVAPHTPAAPRTPPTPQTPPTPHTPPAPKGVRSIARLERAVVAVPRRGVDRHDDPRRGEHARVPPRVGAAPPAVVDRADRDGARRQARCERELGRPTQHAGARVTARPQQADERKRPSRVRGARGRGGRERGDRFARARGEIFVGGSKRNRPCTAVGCRAAVRCGRGGRDAYR